MLLHLECSSPVAIDLLLVLKHSLPFRAACSRPFRAVCSCFSNSSPFRAVCSCFSNTASSLIAVCPGFSKTLLPFVRLCIFQRLATYFSHTLVLSSSLLPLLSQIIWCLSSGLPCVLKRSSPFRTVCFLFFTSLFPVCSLLLTYSFTFRKVCSSLMSGLLLFPKYPGPFRAARSCLSKILNLSLLVCQ